MNKKVDWNNILEFLDSHGIEHRDPVDWEGRKKIQLHHCVFNESHEWDAAILLKSDGGIQYKCFHDSCRGLNIKDFVKKIDPDYYRDELFLPGTQNDSKSSFNPFDPFDADVSSSLPAFPLDCLPDVIRNFVEDVSAVIEAPVDLPVCQVLAVLGACCMGKFRIKLKPGWINELNTYIMGIGDPGDGKSSSLRPCLEPLLEWIQEENARRTGEIRRSEMTITFLEKQLQIMTNSIGGKKRQTKGMPGVADNVTPEMLISKKEEIDKAKDEAVKPVSFIQDDITPEALSIIMNDNGGRAAVISAEGGFSAVLAGRYSSSGSANLDLINKAYDGEPYTRTRVSGGQVALKKPLATIGLFVQPNIVSGMFANQEFRERGFISRFLYSYPKSMIGYRSMQDREVNEEARAPYRDLIREIMECKQGGTIVLNDEAATIFKTFREEIEEQLRPLGDLEPLRDIASRIAGNTGRIMGLLHIARFKSGAAMLGVDENEAEKAVRIGRYFMEHMQGVAYGIGSTQAVMDAKYILSKCDMDKRDKRDNSFLQITQRELHRKCRSKRFKTIKQLEPGLKELENRGYIRREKKGNSVAIHFNPEACNG